jgi:hypothetical protein
LEYCHDVVSERGMEIVPVCNCSSKYVAPTCQCDSPILKVAERAAVGYGLIRFFQEAYNHMANMFNRDVANDDVGDQA